MTYNHILPAPMSHQLKMSKMQLQQQQFQNKQLECIRFCCFKSVFRI
jgi:hypothetical protein